MNSQTEDRLRAFITREVYWDDTEGEIPRDYPVMERNLLDSFGVFNLVSFIEREFNIKLEADEIAPENFATIATMSALIETKAAM
jgi:acyl carrier protein